jgi:hypothetical protein
MKATSELASESEELFVGTNPRDEPHKIQVLKEVVEGGQTFAD